LKSCFNGLATNVTFAFAGETLPNSVTYAIAYDTTHYGFSPIGESAACFTSSGGCGYDSLNVAVSSDTSVGTDSGNVLFDGVSADSTAVPAVMFKASK
jgi:hypothetical protein